MDKFQFRTAIGIRQPRTDAEVNAALTADGMRQAIFHSQFDSSLIRSCMMAADASGASAEDRYTMLAYHALVALETYYQQVLHELAMNPIPPVIRGRDAASADGDGK